MLGKASGMEEVRRTLSYTVGVAVTTGIIVLIVILIKTVMIIAEDHC